MNRLLLAVATSIVMMLPGCAGGPSPLSESAPASVDLTMTGRWMLAAPNAPACGMNFSARPDANAGRVAPEGGCPERFFTSRRWALQQGLLTISDDDSSQLAQLTFTGARFEGKSSTGTPLTLER
jgi:hypothetical protein